MHWKTIALIAVFNFSAIQAYADNFRCPNGNIVSTGDHISTVEAKCDPPAIKTNDMNAPMSFNPEVNPCYKTGEPYAWLRKEPYVEWIYTEGSSLIHTLVFYQGCLREVRTGGFVK